MKPLSHEVPMHTTAGYAGGPLTQNFSDFIAASARLELAYRELQAMVATLNLRLDEQSRALHTSVNEHDNATALLRQLVEAMPCGVLLLSADGAVRLANPEGARLLALFSAQIPSGSAASVTKSQPWLPSPQGVPLLATDGAEQELHFESSAGPHWVSVRRVQIEAPAEVNDPGVSSVLILEDITARKLQEGRREAARNTTALAQVAALLAHEIRNPLASLELFAGLLAESPDRQQEWLSHLRAGIRSLSGTVNNVLTLQGEALPALERVELSEEVGNAIQFLQPLALQAGVRLVHKPMHGELWVLANRSAVHQLVLNLVTNALRHTPQNGEVWACTRRDSPETVHLAVHDTGSGIRPEDLPRLFEGGFSGSGTRPGLGLAVCERLMQHQGGSVYVQSQPAQGSTFTLEFQSV